VANQLKQFVMKKSVILILMMSLFLASCDDDDKKIREMDTIENLQGKIIGKWDNTIIDNPPFGMRTVFEFNLDMTLKIQNYRYNENGETSFIYEQQLTYSLIGGDKIRVVGEYGSGIFYIEHLDEHTLIMMAIYSDTDEKGNPIELTRVIE